MPTGKGARGQPRDGYWFRCESCCQSVLAREWQSRPDGWFILFPPGSPLLLDPLEVRLCSERCAITWLQARVEARMTAAQQGT